MADVPAMTRSVAMVLTWVLSLAHTSNAATVRLDTTATQRNKDTAEDPLGRCLGNCTRSLYSALSKENRDSMSLHELP
jgi:hypothetical protein